MEGYESLDEFLQALPALADPFREKLRDKDNLFQLECGSRTVFIRLEDGKVTVSGKSEDYPVCIVRAEESLVLDLICGRVNPMKALLFGKVSVQGDVKPLLRLCALL